MPRTILTTCQGQALWIYQEFYADENFILVRSEEDYNITIRKNKNLFIVLDDLSQNGQTMIRREILKSKFSGRFFNFVFATNNDSGRKQ